MKAKSGDGKRTFRNNRYIIEPEYVERLVNVHGAKTEGLWVDLLSCVDTSEWEVTENTIDIAVMLRFFPATIYASKVDIVRNKITAARFSGCFTAREYGAFWRFEGNVLNSTDTEVVAEAMHLTANCKTGGLTQIRSNEFNIPIHYIRAAALGEINGTYIVEGNRFAVDKAAKFMLSNAKNNDVVSKETTNIITELGDSVQYGRAEMRIDTRNAREGYDHAPVYINIPEDKNVHFTLKLRHYVNGTFTDGHIEVHTTAGESITIFDHKTGTNYYTGPLHPEGGMSNEIYPGLLKIILSADSSVKSKIRGGGPRGVLDVDIEIYKESI
jgi:hypothetical protein